MTRTATPSSIRRISSPFSPPENTKTELLATPTGPKEIGMAITSLTVQISLPRLQPEPIRQTLSRWFPNQRSVTRCWSLWPSRFAWPVLQLAARSTYLRRDLDRRWFAWKNRSRVGQPSKSSHIRCIWGASDMCRGHSTWLRRWPSLTLLRH